ncbi:hypothetical protein BB558_001680 [Smittium angustum]|uniref:Uncharacterized protein n=1 Tax=Smittium angustum TaxID=133377 RepID=A0A2U1JAQ2_SMIAN|nr:hypothetical protein BB558_001680 [Smittium angustum]
MARENKKGEGKKSLEEEKKSNQQDSFDLDSFLDMLSEEEIKIARGGEGEGEEGKNREIEIRNQEVVVSGRDLNSKSRIIKNRNQNTSDLIGGIHDYRLGTMIESRKTTDEIKEIETPSPPRGVVKDKTSPNLPTGWYWLVEPAMTAYNLYSFLKKSPRPVVCQNNSCKALNSYIKDSSGFKLKTKARFTCNKCRSHISPTVFLETVGKKFVPKIPNKTTWRDISPFPTPIQRSKEIQKTVRRVSKMNELNFQRAGNSPSNVPELGRLPTTAPGPSRQPLNAPATKSNTGLRSDGVFPSQEQSAPINRPRLSESRAYVRTQDDFKIKRRLVVEI